MSLQDNRDIIKELEGIDPKFAKHTMIKNDIIKLFAMERYGTIDLLEQPMCTKCEKPCTWDKGHTAYHVECGTRIQHPITMLEYLRNELKIPDEQLDLIGGALYKEIDLADLGLKIIREE